MKYISIFILIIVFFAYQPKKDGCKDTIRSAYHRAWHEGQITTLYGVANDWSWDKMDSIRDEDFRRCDSILELVDFEK